MLVRYPARLSTATTLGAGWEGDEAHETKAMLLRLADSFERKDATELIRGVRLDGKTGLTDEQVAAANADLFARNPPEVLAAIARGLLPLYDVTADQLRAVKVPLLALMGEYDDVPAARRLVSVIPGAELVELSGATHASVRPAVAPLVAFLARHSHR
jgi:pimeloyl-ACP methyl ester carboxylesterase